MYMFLSTYFLNLSLSSLYFLIVSGIYFHYNCSLLVYGNTTDYFILTLNLVTSLNLTFISS